VSTQPRHTRTFYSRFHKGSEHKKAANAGSQKAPWYKDPIALFTAMVAAFTLALVAVTGMSVWAYMQSERAELFVRDVRFAYGEPRDQARAFDLVMVIKNVGKHIATVTDINMSPIVHVQHKELAETPSYPPQSLVKTAPPIPPDGEVTVNGILGGFKPLPDAPPITDSERAAGILSGNYPMDVIGFVKYNTGFSAFGPSTVGYCFHYVPPSTRLPGEPQFRICDNPNYTYSH
jgi:hypothetical protein